MSAAVSAPPIVTLPCPYSLSLRPHCRRPCETDPPARSYTAGGCPLFNTLDLPADSPRCAGSCAPSPAPAPASTTSAAAPTPSATDSLFNALLLSDAAATDSLPLPAALVKQQDAYPAYLDFGISPGQLEVPPPAPQTSYFTPSQSSSSAVQLPPRGAGADKHQLWDIEELVSADRRKRTRTTPPPPLAAAQTISYGQADLSILPAVPQPPPSQLHTQAASPTPSDEETEVVTVRAPPSLQSSPVRLVSRRTDVPLVEEVTALHLETVIPPLAPRVRAVDPLGLDGPVHPHRAHETAPALDPRKVLQAHRLVELHQAVERAFQDTSRKT